MNKRVKLLLITLLILFCQTTNPLAQLTCDVSSVAWHPNMSQFAFSCDTHIHIYTRDFQFVKTLENPAEPLDTMPFVSSIQWSPDGSYLATATIRFDAPGGDGRASRVAVWNVADGTIHLDIPNRLGRVSWSPNSQFIAIASLYELDSLYFYNIETGNQISECEACSNALAMQWNPNNLNQFVVAHSSKILVFDPLELNQSPVIFNDISAFRGGYNPDGTKIVIYNRAGLQIEVRDTTTWQVISSLPFTVTGPVNSIYWLENGIYIDNAIEGTLLWDGTTQQVLALPINEIRFILSPDGSKYLSPNPDGIFLHDSITGAINGQLLFDVSNQVSSLSLRDSSGNPIPPNAQILPSSSPVIFYANTNPTTVGSVKFDLSGSGTISFTDDITPYEMEWTPSVGVYTLTATPYSGTGGTGTAGTPLTINFSVSNTK